MHMVLATNTNNDTIKNPVFTVVIPLYNKASTIKKTIESVLSQTMQDFEIVVVGGKSTDGSEDIVLSIVNKHIRFVKEIGKGVSAARNQGVDEAHGKLIAFLDADDEWDAQYLETMFSLFNKYPDAGLFGCNHYNNFIKSNVKKIHLETETLSLSDGDEGYFEFYFKYSALVKWIYQTSTVVIPKQIYLELGGFNTNYTYNEDTDLFNRIAYYYPTVFTKKVLTTYNVDFTSIISRYEVANNNDVIMPFIEFYSNLPESIKRAHKSQNDVELYIESLALRKAFVYGYYYNNGAMVRDTLKVIKSPEFMLKKHLLQVWSYLPKRVKKISGSIIQHQG